MKHNEWLVEAQGKINEVLIDCFNSYHLDGWSENHITTKVMESIESLGLEIAWDGKPQKVKWQSFKLKGALEKNFGDIAVIAKVWITSDRFVEGVAFYEAKRQFFDSSWNPIGFSSIKSEQLTNIISKTHASNVLLYDMDFAKNVARASAVPTVFVEELSNAKLASKSKPSLHNYGDFWVKSIGGNLLGMYLDFQKRSVDEIKKLSHGKNKPLIIVNAAVAKTKDLNPEIDNSFIDENQYERLTKINEPKPVFSTELGHDDPSGPTM